MNITLKSLLCLFCITCFLAGTTQASEMKGDAAVGATLYENCVPCHGLNGKGIAGMKIENILGAFTKIKSATLKSPLQIGMQEVVNKFNDQQLLDIATYVNQM